MQSCRGALLMKRKTKKSSGIKKACTLVQLLARLRGTDRNGNGRCSSCGNPVTFHGSNGGHWHPKTHGYNAACLIEANCNIQCPKCNLFLQGNISPYTEFMLSKYGEDIIGEITVASKQILSKEDVAIRTSELRATCKLLAKEKNFTIKMP